jgi:hypothetical protein
MKKITQKILFILFSFFIIYNVNSQQKSIQNEFSDSLILNEENQRFFEENGVVRCASVEVHERRMLNNPSVQSIDAMEDWLSPLVEAKKEQMRLDIAAGRSTSVVVNVPIIFHIITGSASDASNINAIYVNAQIDQLNKDFNNLAGSTNPVAYSADINFIPAVVDPSGNQLAEPGIDRVTGYPGTLSTNDFDNTIKPATIWDRSLYANVWTGDLSGGLLGYAQFPSNSTLNGFPANGGSALTDGVVCLYTSIGSVATPYPTGGVYAAGRTLTHEVGHWLGLRHIWGDATCGDDFCADTPTQSGSSTGCPNTTTCDGQLDQVQNFMDYSYDTCMDLFTFDQVARVITVIDNADGISDLPNSQTGSSSPFISFAQNSISETEGTSCNVRDVNIEVVIANTPTADAIITFNNTGSASDTIDYQILTPTLTFDAGSSTNKTLSIRIFEDSFVETDETIIVNMNLTTTGDAVLSTNGNETLTYTIVNDDDSRSVGGLTTIYSEDFESYNDFEISNIGSWTMNDLDGDTTYGINAPIDFTNSGYVGTYIVFNPSQVTGGTLNAAWDAHTGSKSLNCFNSTGSNSGTALNNDHIFTPQILLNGSGSELKFWAKSVTDQYGLERFNVKVSNTNTNVASFTTIQPSTPASQTPYQSAPIDWTEYTFDLSAYDGQNIYIDFHCVSADAFAFMLDDITITSNVTLVPETSVHTAQQNDLSSSGTVFIDNLTNYVADVSNNNNVDYGCVNVNVSRASGTAQIYQAAGTENFVMDKTFTIAPDNLQNTGDATLKFYFTETEIAAWEVATGNNRSDLVIIKDDGTSLYVSTTLASYGSNITLEGNFTDGINGVYYFGRQEAILSVADNQFNLFSVYPNPSYDGKVSVKLSTTDNVNVNLFDIIGRKVFTKFFKNNSNEFSETFDFSSLSSGVYMLDVDSGGKRAIKKIIIQ